MQEVCCVIESTIALSSRQQVVGAQEAIDVIEKMLPDNRIELGLKKHYANLAVMY